MKKLRRFGTRSFAVALSLVLCAGMVAPAFAASFADVQHAIDSEDTSGTQNGVSWTTSGDRRNITLNDTVTRAEDEVRITVGAGVKVAIDLNGHTIDGNGEVDTVIKVAGEGAELVLDDSTAEYDEDGRQTYAGDGKITGGTGDVQEKPHLGSDAFDQRGGGVSVHDGGSFTMNAGEISGNSANMGGGVYVYGSEFVMNGGKISDNETESVKGAGANGGGVYVGGGAAQGSFTMTGGEISGNTSATNGGGVTVAGSGTLTMTGGEISGNDAKYGGGLYNYTNGTTAMTGGTLANNTATKAADDVFSTGTLNLVGAKDMDTTLEEDGKAVSGWYYDGRYDGAWDEGQFAYTKQPSSGEKNQQITLKAAHDEYFALTDEDGTVLADVEKGTVLDLSKLEVPTLDGFHFTGWTVDGELVETLEVTGPATLTAKWEKDETEQPDEPTPPVTPPTTTPDVPTDPGVTEIEEEEVPLAGLPLELAAEEPLTRGQLIAILHWMDGEPAAELSSFLDVAADHDFALAIGWAQENGIAKGVTETEFAPDQVVTRGQLIDFLNRYARYVGSELVLEVEGNPDETLTWAMAEEIINDFFARLYA